MRTILFEPRKFLIALFLVIGAGIIQNTTFIAINGIHPNLALIVLIVLSFFINDIFSFFVLVLIGALAVNFVPGLDRAVLSLIGASIFAFLVRQYIPLRSFVNALFIISLGTIIFYLLASPGFILLEGFTLIGEMFYNIIVGSILFIVMYFLLNYGQGSRITF